MSDLIVRDPPVAPGLPLLGSLRPMITDPLQFLVKTHLALGPVFALHVLNRRFVVLAGAEANQFMIGNERAHLRNGPVFGGFGTELGGELFLASADGDVHKRLRSIQTPSYSADHVEKRVPEVVRGIRRRLAALAPGQRLDVQRLFQLLLAEQVGLLLHNQDDVAEVLDDLIRVFRTALSVRVMRQWPPAVLLWPAYRRSKRRILAYAERVVARHRAEPVEGRNDLVDDAIAAVARQDLIREENLRLLTLGPLFGGIDTASNTSAFALFNVLARPAVRARVMAEVHEVFAADEAPGWDAFKGMKALRGLMMETLRMFPVAYLAPRYVEKEFTFAGYRIAAGQQLFMATAVPHFLPDLFPEPYTFDIDRYSEPRREHARAGAFAPFGTGVHTCLGSRFAQSQMMVTLATLLHALELELDPPGYELKVRSTPVTMPVGLRVRVSGAPRPSSEAPTPWPRFAVS